MFVIRKAQMAAFERSAIEAFEDRTYTHLLESFPRQCALLGEAGMRRTIQYGWQKAKSYQLFAESCVRSYIDLMFVLGSEFDNDPSLPWAADILQDTSGSDEVARGDRLYDQAWDYLDHVANDYKDPSGRSSAARFVAELQRLQLASEEPITDSTWPICAESLEARLRETFPAKCAYIGSDVVAETLEHEYDKARQYKITTDRGVRLIAMLGFGLGGDFDRDLFLPWAAATLTDKSIPDQLQRTERLMTEGISYLLWHESSLSPEG